MVTLSLYIRFAHFLKLKSVRNKGINQSHPTGLKKNFNEIIFQYTIGKNLFQKKRTWTLYGLPHNMF